MQTIDKIFKTISTITMTAETGAAITPELIKSVEDSLKVILTATDKIAKRYNLINTQEYINLQDSLNRWSIQDPTKEFKF